MSVEFTVVEVLQKEVNEGVEGVTRAQQALDALICAQEYIGLANVDPMETEERAAAYQKYLSACLQLQQPISTCAACHESFVFDAGDECKACRQVSIKRAISRLTK